MSTEGKTAALFGLGLNLIEAGLRVSLAIRQAHLEGRELSEPELDALRAEALAARAELENATKP